MLYTVPSATLEDEIAGLALINMTFATTPNTGIAREEAAAGAKHEHDPKALCRELQVALSTQLSACIRMHSVHPPVDLDAATAIRIQLVSVQKAYYLYAAHVARCIQRPLHQVQRTRGASAVLDRSLSDIDAAFQSLVRRFSTPQKIVAGLDEFASDLGRIEQGFKEAFRVVDRESIALAGPLLGRGA